MHNAHLLQREGGAEILVTPLGFQSYTFKENGTTQDITSHGNGVHDLDGHIIVYGTSTSASRDGDEGGWAQVKAAVADAVLKVKLTSNTNPGSGWFTLWASCESSRVAESHTYASGATATTFSQVDRAAVTKVASGANDEQIHSPSSFQPVNDLTARVYVGTWNFSDGVYWVETAIVAKSASSEALATSPGSLGNFLVSSAVSSARHRVIMANASGPNTRRVAGQLTPGFGG